MGDRVGDIVRGRQATGRLLGDLAGTIRDVSGVVGSFAQLQSQRLSVANQLRSRAVEIEAEHPGEGQKLWEEKVGKWFKPDTVSDVRASIREEGERIRFGQQLRVLSAAREETRFQRSELSALADDMGNRVLAGRITEREALDQIRTRGESKGFSEDEVEGAQADLITRIRSKSQGRAQEETRFRRSELDALAEDMSNRVLAGRITEREAVDQIRTRGATKGFSADEVEAAQADLITRIRNKSQGRVQDAERQAVAAASDAIADLRHGQAIYDGELGKVRAFKKAIGLDEDIPISRESLKALPADVADQASAIVERESEIRARIEESREIERKIQSLQRSRKFREMGSFLIGNADAIAELSTGAPARPSRSDAPSAPPDPDSSEFGAIVQKAKADGVPIDEVLSDIDADYADRAIRDRARAKAMELYETVRTSKARTAGGRATF